MDVSMMLIIICLYILELLRKIKKVKKVLKKIFRKVKSYNRAQTVLWNNNKKSSLE